MEKSVMNENVDKVERVLGIYSKLINGEIVNKAEEALKLIRNWSKN